MLNCKLFVNDLQNLEENLSRHCTKVHFEMNVLILYCRTTCKVAKVAKCITNVLELKSNTRASTEHTKLMQMSTELLITQRLYTVKQLSCRSLITCCIKSKEHPIKATKHRISNHRKHQVYKSSVENLAVKIKGEFHFHLENLVENLARARSLSNDWRVLQQLPFKYICVSVCMRTHVYILQQSIKRFNRIPAGNPLVTIVHTIHQQFWETGPFRCIL